MAKFIISFGSSQLKKFFVRATYTMVVIEAENMEEARKQAFAFDGIGNEFCTSYDYDSNIEQFIKDGRTILTLEELEAKRIKD